MTEIVQGNIGSVGEYDVSFADGALVIKADAKYAVGSTAIVQTVDAAKVLDAMAKAIPGTLDDAVFGVIKAALGVKA